VSDFVKRNDVLVAGVVGGIVGALLVKGLPDISGGSTPSIDLPKGGSSNEISKFFDSVNLDISIHDRIAPGLIIGHIMTALPLEYKIAGLKSEIAKVKAQYQTGPGLEAEADVLLGDEIKEKDIDLLSTYIEEGNSEGKNKIMRKALVDDGIFEIGEGTNMDCTNVDNKAEKGTIILTINGSDNKENTKFMYKDKPYYIAEDQKMIVLFDEQLKVKHMEGKVTEDKKNGLFGFLKKEEEVDVEFEK